MQRTGDGTSAQKTTPKAAKVTTRQDRTEASPVVQGRGRVVDERPALEVAAVEDGLGGTAEAMTSNGVTVVVVGSRLMVEEVEVEVAFWEWVMVAVRL